MTDQDGSATVDALKVIAAAAGRVILSDIGAWHRDGAADCAVFSYKRDFPLLWGVDHDGLDGIARSLIECRGETDYTFIVVWDGVPNAEVIAVSHYVSPYDWAAALSLAIYDKNRPEPHGLKLRFLILNLPSAPREGFMQRSLFAFHNILPWVQGYAVCAAGTEWLAEAALSAGDATALALLRQAVPQHRQDAETLLDDVRDPLRVTTTFHTDDDAAERMAYLGAIREAWRQEFLKPGDRHALANIVGPLLLAAGLPNDRSPGSIRQRCASLIEATSTARQALTLVLEQLGLLHVAAAKGASFEPIGLEKDGGVFGRRKGVRVLLVDDQFALGYQHVLTSVLLGADYDPAQARVEGDLWDYTASDLARIRCASSADSLFVALENLSPVDDWSLPRMLDIPDCDVLLLDLRLWSNDSGQRKTFMDRLVRLYGSLKAKRLSDPHVQAAWRAAQRIADGDEASEIQALPLLALLISHYDPSLPIILFSSTHQRDVVEAVADRPNIITCFAKPLLTGYGEEQPPATLIRELIKAVRRALDLHEARIVWERISKVAWTKRNPAFTMMHKSGYTPYNYNDSKYPSCWRGVRAHKLQHTLAGYFQNYLADERYFDFAALPFEFLEGVMTPDASNLVADDVPSDAVFQWYRGSRRNRFGAGLKEIRNQKAHGHAPPPKGFKDRENWRVATIIEFLALVDYIEETHCILDGRITKDILRAAASSAVNGGWLMLVAHAIGQGILDSRIANDESCGSDTTVAAVARLLT